MRITKQNAAKREEFVRAQFALDPEPSIRAVQTMLKTNQETPMRMNANRIYKIREQVREQLRAARSGARK